MGGDRSGVATTIALALLIPALSAQNPAGWPEGVRDIRIRSSADQSRQPALFYAPAGEATVPLLVTLHTWSGDYKQKASAPYARWCIEQGWAFVHPDFRGPNRNPNATGSELVVRDILDAVRFAKENARVDPERIYLVGTSGGGYAALLMAGRYPELWAGVSAWVPVFDLAAWHGDTKAAGRGYWKDVEASCGGAPGSGAEVDREYRRRSASTYLGRARAVNLDINAGIHDGHTGSVPISHSLRAFNSLASEDDRFAEEDITFLTTKRRTPDGWTRPRPDPAYGAKQPLVRRRSGRARVTIFDGGHEGLPDAALTWLRGQRRSEPWPLHFIDPASDSLRGADGVRLGDPNGDGRLDTVTGWEEGEAIRVCIHPGPDRVRDPWPAVTVGKVRDAEDAMFVELDSGMAKEGSGQLDVVSCTEGSTRTVFVHWAPPAAGDYLDPTRWTTAAIPATAGKEAWMFAIPMDVDGENGIDLIVGSKRQGRAKRAGSVSWLRSPKNPRDVGAWKLEKIVDAGWIMTLRSAGKGTELAPIYVSDRKHESRGIYRLVPSRTADGVRWRREDLGGRDHEVMFMDLRPESHTPIAATRNGRILDLAMSQRIPNPFGIPWGKAVRLGDIDGDGRLDLVHTANVDRTPEHPGVCWFSLSNKAGPPHIISDHRGTKFDRIELVDVDADGDLDVLTCEENAPPGSRGLGVVWYENPWK